MSNCVPEEQPCAASSARADPTYLQTFFAAVDEAFGDVRGYLASLGVDAQAVGVLQDRLLEPADG